VIDPAERISCEEALRHDLFKHVGSEKDIGSCKTRSLETRNHVGSEKDIGSCRNILRTLTVGSEKDIGSCKDAKR
jgi:hypothetical protein